MKIIAIAASLGILAASALGAQQWAVEGHGNYARGTQTHTNSWGAGAQLGATWGEPRAAIQVVTSLAGDWMKQEHDGPTTWSVSYDGTIQPGRTSPFTPYAGGSVNANWLSGDGAPSGAQYGLQYIIGVQYKPSASAKWSGKIELRPGYVNTQESQVMWRLAIDRVL